VLVLIFSLFFLIEIVTNFSVAWIGEVKRVTKETNVSVKINLDGSAVADNNTRTPFLDHMLDV
jgi:imidazoleglycerol-phosphate dehydratase